MVSHFLCTSLGTLRDGCLFRSDYLVKKIFIQISVIRRAFTVFLIIFKASTSIDIISSIIRIPVAFLILSFISGSAILQLIAAHLRIFCRQIVLFYILFYRSNLLRVLIIWCRKQIYLFFGTSPFSTTQPC